MQKPLKPLLASFLALLLSFLNTSYALSTISKPDQSTNKDFSVIVDSQQVLALLKTGLDMEKTIKGDIFEAEIMDDIIINEDIALIPQGSILSGKVIKVKKAGFVNKDAYIRISIDKIAHESGKTITLNKPFNTEIYTPGSKRFKEKLITRLPYTIASSGSSLALGQVSSIAREAVWGISMGAGIAVGILSSIVVPAKDKTRAQTCADRAFSPTPVITLSSILKKGETFSIKEGQFINIYLNKKNVQLLLDEFWAKSNKPV